MTSKQVFFLWTVLCLGACASGRQAAETCPSEQEEPISVCRARLKCQGQVSSIGVGVGVGLGRFGVGVGQSQSTSRYERCLDQDLIEQKQKAQTMTSSP